MEEIEVNAKMFFRGLGIGMVLTALILCIFYRHDSEVDIIRKAKQLGMVFPSVESASVESAVSEQAKQPTPIPTVKPTARPRKEKKEDKKVISTNVETSTSEIKDSKKTREMKQKLENSRRDITSASRYNNRNEQ